MARKQLKAYGVTFDVISYENDPYFIHLEGHMRGNYFFAFVLQHYVEPNSLFIDVGANCGVTSVLAAMLQNLQIVAIEPSRVFHCLRETLEANGISTARLLNCCAGDKIGVTFFADAADSSASHMVMGPGGAIPVKPLDLIRDELGLPEVEFIKIDVEGFESSVLDGMRSINEQFKPLIFMEFNSFTTTAYGNISPWALLLRVREDFGSFFEKEGDRLVERTSNNDLLGFLHRNMIHHGCVDDIVFTRSEEKLRKLRHEDRA
jgi:FkbM family methyltransferase